MPHVLNGIGTWYYGKVNQHVRRGQCEFCHYYSDLTSYEATLYFVVAMIPLIPLKKVRVVDECSACKRHRFVPLKKWLQMQDEALTEALSAYAADPRDPAKAVEAIQTTTGYRQAGAFAKLAPVVRQNQRAHQPTLLALGAAHSFFGQSDEAEACYREALRLGDTTDARRSLALVLMRTGRPDEARPLLQPVLNARDAENRGLLYLLIESYQSLGRHDQALALADEIRTAIPTAAADAELAGLQRTSERNLSSGRPVASRNLMPPAAAAPRSGSALLPRLAGPAILATLFLLYCFIGIYRGGHRTVHVVSGVSQPYEVIINGQRLTLAPHAIEPIELAEGDVRMEFPGPSMRHAPKTFAMHSSFWSRPFGNRTFILNPDQLAIVYTESTEYAKNPSEAMGARMDQVYAGQTGYVISGMDYVFREFPDEIKVDSQSSRPVKKQRVGLYSNLTPMQAMNGVMKNFTKERAAEYARALAEAEPEDAIAVRLAAGLQPSIEDGLKMLRERLSERPILVEWHRTYQSVMESVHPEQELYPEYKALLEREPDNAVLIYLLGRVAKDPAEAAALFRRAAQSKPGVGYGYFALGYEALCRGDYGEALDLFRNAKALTPKAVEFDVMESMAREALGLYGELLTGQQAEEARDGQSAGPILAQVYYLACSGQYDRATAVENNFLGRVDKKWPPEEIARMRDRLAAVVAYARGDGQEYARRLQAADPEGNSRFNAVFALGRIGEAESALSGGKGDASDWLLLYVASARAGKTADAARQLSTAVAHLEKGGRDPRRLARWLAGEAPATPKEAAELMLLPPEKCVALCALATRFPAQEADYLALARRFNYSRQFPRLFLDEVLRER